MCDISSVLVICNYLSLNEAILFANTYLLDIKYLSVSQSNNLAKKSIAERQNMIIWVFLKGDCNEQDFVSFLVKLEDNDLFIIEEAYQILGECNYIIKLHTNSISGIDSFLGIARSYKMVTNTKFVLSTIFENGEIIVHNNKDKDNIFDIKKNLNYANARIRANTQGIINQR